MKILWDLVSLLILITTNLILLLNISSFSSYNCKNYKTTSDYNNHINRHGKPRGGNCWFFNKEINLISFERLNNTVSKVRIKDDKNGFIDIYGVWLQFDDKSDARLCEFQSNLSLIAGQMKSICYKNSLIIGIFNASFERKNRFDIILSEFIRKQKLSDCFKLFNRNTK